MIGGSWPLHANVSDSLGAYFSELKDLLDAMPLERIESIGGPSTPPIATTSRCSSSVTAAAPRPPAPGVRPCEEHDTGPASLGISLTDNGDRAGERPRVRHVFKEQLVNLIRTGDVLVVLSGSGNSQNVLEAMRYARAHVDHGDRLPRLRRRERRGARRPRDRRAHGQLRAIEDVHMISPTR